MKNRVSGISWEKFIQTKIMQPLQMNNSLTSTADINDKTNLAIPHSTTTGKIRSILPFLTKKDKEDILYNNAAKF